MPALPQQVNFTTACGSRWTAGFTFTNDDGTPDDLTGATFKFVIRSSTTDATEPGLVSVTATETSQGYLTVTGNVVLVVLYPAATALLGRNAWPHTLWLDPGDPVNATAMVEGQFYSSLVAAA